MLLLLNFCVLLFWRKIRFPGREKRLRPACRQRLLTRKSQRPSMRRPQDKDVISDCAEGPVYKTAALFHTGGVVPARIQCPYDGNDDAIINVDDKYLFTWEVIRKYLRDLRLVQTNYNRFVLSMEEIWGICIEQCDTLKALFPVLLQTSFSSSDHLKQLRLAFRRAVHGYITLLDIDWNDLYRCRCQFDDAWLFWKRSYEL